MRKEFVDFWEFENWLNKTGYSELDFLHHAKLGIYTVREWRRHKQAPCWAVEFMELVHEVKLLKKGERVVTKSEQEQLEAAMTAEEFERYYTGSKDQMKEIEIAVKARLAAQLIG